MYSVLSLVVEFQPETGFLQSDWLMLVRMKRQCGEDESGMARISLSRARPKYQMRKWVDDRQRAS